MNTPALIAALIVTGLGLMMGILAYGGACTGSPTDDGATTMAADVQRNVDDLMNSGKVNRSLEKVPIAALDTK